ERIAIEKEILRRADHVVATCSDEVFELVRIGGARGRLTVVPCGVDLDLFTPEGRRARRRPGRRRIVCVGRLVARKGVGNAISALAALPDTELVVAGGPPRAQLCRDPEARRLRALAEECGVGDRVDLRGRMDRADVAALLRSADAVVCVPWYEPFGIVPLEAMACGTPVVASAVGGMIDSVVDDVTGIHVPPRDPDRLAEALAPLLADPERRAVYGSAGVDRARRRYGWPRIAAATLDVYARAAARPLRRPGAAPDTRRFALVPRGVDHLASLRDALAELEADVERL